MTNSNLVDYKRISPNSSNPRNSAIKRITIHHMAGNLSVETCGNVFANKSRQASSNYSIGTDGRVGLYVEEKNRAWTSGNAINDNQAVTIEVANNTLAPNWTISDKALTKLIDLCVDICRRNGLTRVIDISAEVNKISGLSAKTKYVNSYNIPVGACLLTQHCWFQATACPAGYIKGKWGYITSEINRKLGNTNINVETQKYLYGGVYYDKVFDPTYYANKYKDLKNAFGTDSKALFNHFCTYGMNERRQAIANFNVNVYHDNNPDLVKAFGGNWREYYKHYCVYGYKEKRKTV